MKPSVTSGQVYRFGLFEADVARNTLRRSGARVKIQDQPFRVLVALLERPAEIVSREELRQTLWPDGTYVDFEGSLNVIVKKLRAAIDDDSENPRFVETVPRRGYRFIAPVVILHPEAVEAPPQSKAEIDSRASNSDSSSVNSPATKQRILLAVSAVILILAGMAWRYFLRNHSVVQAAPKAIAVLPFANEEAGQDFDYLSYAIANDLVTDLSYAHKVAVRPFAATAKYSTHSQDAVGAGQELGVSHVLSGAFLRDHQNLQVRLQLIDVAQNKALWKGQLEFSPQELVGLHQKLADLAISQLLPAMNISDAAGDEIPSPKNEEAFTLFVHSTMVPLDPGPNQMGIQKLERSVSLDAGYAPAWHQLAWRYYIQYHYGNGGDAAKAKSLAAYKRERELDPNAEPWVSLRVEEGDLQGAYDEVSDFVRRHPSDPLSFDLAYIFRYAGLLDEARKECEAAFAEDPVHGYRSCATPFVLAGDYSGAEKYINLDPNSGYAALLRMDIALRKGDTPGASSEAGKAAQLGYNRAAADLVRVCLAQAPQPELTKAVSQVESDPVSSGDPEWLYRNAEVLSRCGQREAAIDQLRKAIHGKYCSYPAMDNDPLFDSIRQDREFAHVRSDGIQCQQSFLAHRKQTEGGLRVAR
ncbi:MAG TPA: winged helix-turn-helix domain-containing protein [Candidatus Sulfotelmatobacter sp.]|nr:winged helix-turn-helix domain-containing protein [Candidatus Sulfotelmatobacter sp.]